MSCMNYESIWLGIFYWIFYSLKNLNYKNLCEYIFKKSIHNKSLSNKYSESKFIKEGSPKYKILDLKASTSRLSLESNEFFSRSMPYQSSRLEHSKCPSTNKVYAWQLFFLSQSRRTNLVNFPKQSIILKNQIITTLSSMNDSCLQDRIEFRHCSWQLELFRNISRLSSVTEKCLKINK